MDVKITLPLLPLRDIVVFPSMVIPLFVGRDKSISALNEVMKKDKKIILVTQKNSEIDDPKKTDIFMYGCEGSILQLLKLPDGTVKVLVEGIKRVKILDGGMYWSYQDVKNDKNFKSYKILSTPKIEEGDYKNAFNNAIILFDKIIKGTEANIFSGDDLLKTVSLQERIRNKFLKSKLK